MNTLASGGEGQIVAFDRVGKELVTRSDSGAITVRDAFSLEATPAPIFGRASLRPRVNPTRPLLLADNACGPNGDAFGLRDLALWDISAGIDIGIDFLLNCGFWTPDGTSFVDKDRTSIRIWDVDGESWAKAACAFVGRDLSQDEWAKYGPEAPYHRTCGK